MGFKDHKSQNIYMQLVFGKIQFEISLINTIF